MLGSHYRPSHLRQVQSSRTRCCNEILLPICASFRGAMGLQFPFHGRQCTMSSHSSCRTALVRVRILNVWIGRHDLGSQSHRACMGFSRQTLGSSCLPPVTIHS
ncbi:hypothetical protein TNCV_4517811 [Trichonephila clavipes]|nr:hypothetical protein TNCV_4517811 [Trichonephila clavipes]